jgi:hypothetical protein
MTAKLTTIADSPERQRLLDKAGAVWLRSSQKHSAGELAAGELADATGELSDATGAVADNSAWRAVVAWLPESFENLARASDATRAELGGQDFCSKLWSSLAAPVGATPMRVVLIGSARAYDDERRDQAELAVMAALRKSRLPAGDQSAGEPFTDEPFTDEPGADEPGGRGSRGTGMVVRLLRVGQVLSAEFGLPPSFARSPRWRWCWRWCWRWPAMSSGQDCFVDPDELIAAVGTLLASAVPDFREHALLGERRELRDAFAEYSRQEIAWGRPAPQLAPLTGMGRLAKHLAGRLAAMIRGQSTSAVSRPCAAILQPTDTPRLLALCGTLNRSHVAIAGFNTGVNHFGWHYPGKTLVQTTRSGKRIRLRDGILEADAGVLIKDAVAVLREAGHEFLVLPNYSYVSLGTVFMVPVHGSGCEVSTLGETIVKALVYDPATDRIERIRRGDSRFESWMYNPASGVVVLRLWFRVRPAFRYFRQRRTLASPTAAELWNAFRDPDASHVEARKQHASDKHVTLYRYRLEAEGLGGDAEELPRDTIGRVWDRIEQNRLAAGLFHAFVRNFGFHVELFLNESEFAVFWRNHGGLPLAKIQFRLARRDGLPHSPCGDCDRMSIDLFMSRRRSARFLAFVKEHLPHARFNRGKHSM